MRLDRRAIFAGTVLWGMAQAIFACESGAAPGAETVATTLPARTRLMTVEEDRVVGECYRFWTVANIVEPHLLMEPDAIGKQLGATPLARTINCIFMLGGKWEGQTPHPHATPAGLCEIKIPISNRAMKEPTGSADAGGVGHYDDGI